jgi:heme/copper-type cytochrome/quinol oxidase subunit 2
MISILETNKNMINLELVLKRLLDILLLSIVVFSQEPEVGGEVQQDQREVCTCWLQLMMILAVISGYVFVATLWLHRNKRQNRGRMRKPLRISRKFPSVLGQR